MSSVSSVVVERGTNVMKMNPTRFFGTGAIVFALVFASVAVNTWAQGTVPSTLDKVTLSADAAKRTLNKMQINAATARAIVDACVDFGRSSNASYSVYVLAPNGDIVDAHVMDGQLPIGVETALLKAKTALYARSSSSAVAQRFSTVDGRLIRLDLGKASGLAYYFVGGGLPIVVEGQMIGAVGVGGGNADEMCAYTALTKVLGPQPPLTPAAAPPGQTTAPGRGGRGEPPR
jgi:glc operon protein GlcG